MKRIILIILLVFSLIMGMLPAFAAETSASGTTGSASVKADASVAVEDAGILPTSYFYFLKEWGRGIRKAFIFNSVSKAEYELKVADQKLIELKKVEQLNPKDKEAIKEALDNYNENAARLEARLEAIKDTSKNPKVDEFLTKFTTRTIEHQKLFEDLKEKHADIKKEFEAVQAVVDGALIEVPQKFDDANKFKERIQSILDKDKENHLAELKVAAVLGRLENAKAEGEASVEISSAKSDLIIKFGGRVSSGEIDLKELQAKLEELPIADAARLKMVDEIKERSKDAKLKAELEAFRPQMIKEAEIQGRISADETKQAIDYAKTLITKLEGLVGSAPNTSLSLSLEISKKHLANAEVIYKGGKYGAAFGEANAAASVAKRGIEYAGRKNINIGNESSYLKAWFDKLVVIAKEKGIYSVPETRLDGLFRKAEKALLKAKSVEHVEEIKAILAEIESLIRLGGLSPEESGRVEVSGYVIGIDKEEFKPDCKPEMVCPAYMGVRIVYKAKLDNSALITIKVESLAEPETPAVGDRFKARGVLDKETSILLVKGPEDYFKIVTRAVVNEPIKVEPVPVLCTKEYAPVCGSNGKTYSNKCNATAAGVEISYAGQCKAAVAPPAEDRPQYCTQEYAPVCGADGKTYSNKCFAGISGAQVQYTGECKEQPVVISVPPPSEVYEFKIQSDDNSLTPSSITVPKGSKVRIYFFVSANNVYYGGQDFRSAKFKTETIKAGGSTSVEFVADESFEFSSFWPTSNAVKQTGKVIVQ